MKYILVGLLILTAVVAAAVCILYALDMRAVRERIAAGRHLVEADCGRIEYGEAGRGAPVLVAHGGGGGYDHGLLTGRVLGDGYRLIAPSRFGYLGSAIPPDASPQAQAEAYACLLDALNVERVTVVAVSMGGPSALEFAARHPERTEALVMISAVSYLEPRADGARGGQDSLIGRVMGSDFVFWLFTKTMPNEVLAMAGVPKAVQEAASPEDLQVARRLLDAMHPMSLRMPGLRLDLGREFPKDSPLDVRVPTLVIAARDDTLVDISHAQHTVEKIPGAQLMLLEDGGHFLLGRIQQVQSSVAAFLTGTP